MILVRDTFHLKFGKAKDAKALMSEAKDIFKKFGYDNNRILTDLVTGHAYTLLLETEWNSLTDWENSMKQGLGSE